MGTALRVRRAGNPSENQDGSSFLLRDLVARLNARGITAGGGRVQSGNQTAFKTFLLGGIASTSATLVLLHAQNQDTYTQIKRVTDLGAHRTICAVGSKITYFAEAQQVQSAGFQNQHLDNLALKFNFKNGGRNHIFADSNYLQAQLGGQIELTRLLCLVRTLLTQRLAQLPGSQASPVSLQAPTRTYRTFPAQCDFRLADKRYEPNSNALHSPTKTNYSRSSRIYRPWSLSVLLPGSKIPKINRRDQRMVLYLQSDCLLPSCSIEMDLVNLSLKNACRKRFWLSSELSML